MKKLMSVLLVVVAGLFVLSSVSLAQHSHGGMSMGSSMKMEDRKSVV